MKFNTTAMAVVAMLVILAAPTGVGAQEAPDGAALYKAKCAMCHGQDGAGKTPMGQKLNIKDLRSPEVQKQSDAELAKSISTGKGKMPGFDNKISPDDIRALVSYIRSFAAQKK